MPLTDQQILDAKNAINLYQPRHEHDDCIRMAYEWLDAQKKLKSKRSGDWKHLVQYWCGSYISEDDVKIAAHLHPDIQFEGSKVNISRRLVLPKRERLADIGEAYQHFLEMDANRIKAYATHEK